MADFVKAEDMAALKSIHEDLLELDEGLTPDNVKFLESLEEWEGSFTVGQAEYLQKLQERLL